MGRPIDSTTPGAVWSGGLSDGMGRITRSTSINKRMRKARTAEIQIKGLTRAHGLVSGLTGSANSASGCTIDSIIWRRDLVERSKKKKKPWAYYPTSCYPTVAQPAGLS